MWGGRHLPQVRALRGSPRAGGRARARRSAGTHDSNSGSSANGSSNGRAPGVLWAVPLNTEHRRRRAAKAMSVSCARQTASIYSGLLFGANDRLDSLPGFHHRKGLDHLDQREPVRDEPIPRQIVSQDDLQRLVIVPQVGSKTAENRDFIVENGVGVDRCHELRLIIEK